MQYCHQFSLSILQMLSYLLVYLSLKISVSQAVYLVGVNLPLFAFLLRRKGFKRNKITKNFR